MSDSVIRVEQLSKRYELGGARHDTLRDRLVHAFRAPFKRMRGETAPDPTEFWALREVSFDVKRGEVLGVIGRNGAGKSTLLKILSRITEPTSGRVSIRGRVASLLEVGTGFHPELTGRENIHLNGAILGMSRAEIRRKFDEIVAFSEVERFLDTPVKHYSSGMYVRLAFAVAAHLEPEILIVDEVLAVGDAEFQTKCLGKMESIAQSHGRTILFVSHNMSAIVRLCSRTLVLQKGGVVYDGRSDQAINAYLGGGATKTASRVDLGGHASEDGAIRLHELILNDGTPVVNRRRFTATLRGAASARVGSIGLGVGICGLDGRRILTLESDYAGDYFEIERAGEFALQFEMPVLDLVPGRYRIELGLFDGNHRVVAFVSDCCTMEIQPGGDTPAHLHDVYGEFRPQAVWRRLD
jgi:lipopolysaccharide transport system ATP-binding protein